MGAAGRKAGGQREGGFVEDAAEFPGFVFIGFRVKEPVREGDDAEIRAAGEIDARAGEAGVTAAGRSSSSAAARKSCSTFRCSGALSDS